MLLEDAWDMALMLESLSRAVGRNWIEEVREYAARAQAENALEGLI